LSLSLLGTAAHAADAKKSSPFPDLPYAKRWVFSPGATTKPSRPADGRTALRYNPICVSQDLPCNGDPSDYYNEGSGWTVVVDTVVELERVEVFGRSVSENTVCVGSDCREYLLDLKTIYERSTGPVKIALWGMFRDAKLLEPCVPLGQNLTPPFNSMESTWAVATLSRSFFLNNGIQPVVDDTFDTRQSNGTVVRYQVSALGKGYGVADVKFVRTISAGDASNKCR